MDVGEEGEFQGHVSFHLETGEDGLERAAWWGGEQATPGFLIWLSLEFIL